MSEIFMVIKEALQGFCLIGYDASFMPVNLICYHDKSIKNQSLNLRPMYADYLNAPHQSHKHNLYNAC